MIELSFYFAAALWVINANAELPESQKQFTPVHFIRPFLAPPDGKCAPELKKCDPDDIFYSVDGSCNNLKYEYSYFGQANYPFERWLPANYADGIDRSRVSIYGNPLPNSRKLRTTLLPNAEYRDGERNSLFYAFGQYSSHDPTEHRPLVPKGKCCTEDGKPANPMPYECGPQIMPRDDEFYSKFGVTCVTAKRSTNTIYKGCSLRPVRQVNLETAYLDLSILYGSDKDRAEATRAFKGGLLKTEKDSDNSFQEYPIRRKGPENCPNGGLGPGLGRNAAPEDKACFFSGCDAAKKYNLYTLDYGYNYGYNPNISPQTFHEYTTTVGRSGHSTIRGSFVYGNQFKRPLTYRLRDKYFNLDFLLKKNVFLNIVQAYAFEECSEQDKFLTEEINNFLFPVSDMTYGGDLSALGIDRGREFGIQTYNEYRKLCGIPPLTSFEDFAADIVYPEDIQKLKSLYESFEDIDLYVAGFMEKPYHGSMVGPTFTCLLGAQFQQWKYADRLFFEFPSAKFTKDQLAVIRSTTFAQMICIANPGMEKIPQNAYYVVSDWNPLVRCSDLIHQIDLTPWAYDE